METFDEALYTRMLGMADEGMSSKAIRTELAMPLDEFKRYRNRYGSRLHRRSVRARNLLREKIGSMLAESLSPSQIKDELGINELEYRALLRPTNVVAETGDRTLRRFKPYLTRENYVRLREGRRPGTCEMAYLAGLITKGLRRVE